MYASVRRGWLKTRHVVYAIGIYLFDAVQVFIANTKQILDKRNCIIEQLILLYYQRS